MCGIFGYVGPDDLDSASAKFLVKHAQQRGRDSSGMVIRDDDAYHAYRADYPIGWLLKRIPPLGNLFFGHSRLVTNGTGDNQPVLREQVIVLHNGIVVNEEAIWKLLGKSPELTVDTEVIPAIIASHLEAGGTHRDRGRAGAQRLRGRRRLRRAGPAARQARCSSPTTAASSSATSPTAPCSRPSATRSSRSARRTSASSAAMSPR